MQEKKNAPNASSQCPAHTCYRALRNSTHWNSSIHSYTYTFGVSSLLKSSQELRVTLTVKFTVVSSGTPSHEPSERGTALGREGGKKGGKEGAREVGSML